eukprot:EW711002.1.p1 GENE.EW711002.1~~EW711002.1.p1  ORF type:complete len:123 (+),score=37.15 EW711002.1:162-530(+)
MLSIPLLSLLLPSLCLPTPIPPPVRIPPRQVCVERCVCKRGWFGNCCDSKKVSRKEKFKFGKCRKGFKCRKDVHIKCKCTKLKKFHDNKHSKHSDDYSYKKSEVPEKKDKIPTQPAQTELKK